MNSYWRNKPLKKHTRNLNITKKSITVYRKRFVNFSSLFAIIMIVNLVCIPLPLSEPSKVSAGPTIPWNVVDTYWKRYQNGLALPPYRGWAGIPTGYAK